MIVVLTALFPAASLRATQAIDATTLPPADRLSDASVVWVVTLGRGERPHTLFGHTAVVVRDPTTDFSVAFNYGTFDFGEGFLLRFLGGELDYHLSVAEGDAPIREAMYFKRGYAVQQLALSPTQTRLLYRELRTEAQPANRDYRYRFIDRNCATKVVDVIDRALGDAVIWPPPREEDGEASADAPTYRDLLRGHLLDRPWYRLGIDLIMGQPVDEATTPKQRGFLPIHLMELLGGTLVLRDGAAAPIVAGSDAAEFAPLPTEPRRDALWVALSVLGLGVVGTLASWRLGDSKGIDRAMRGFDGLLLLTTGLGGVAMMGMWAWSAHDVIGPNWHLPWMLPTHAVAAAWVVQRPRMKWLRGYLVAAAALSGGVAVFWLWLPQSMPLAAWPLAGLVALRCAARVAGGRRDAETPRRQEGETGIDTDDN